MIDDGDIFKCHDSTDQAVFHSEMGSTYAILQAGYNIASLMVRQPFHYLILEVLYSCILVT